MLTDPPMDFLLQHAAADLPRLCASAALALMLVSWAAALAMRMLRRVPADAPAAVAHLAAAAAVTGTGVWSAQLLLLPAAALPPATGYHALGLLAAWMLGSGAAMVAGAMLLRAPAPPIRRVAAVLALVVTMLGPQLVAFVSLMTTPPLAMDGARLAVAGGAALAAAGVVVLLARRAGDAGRTASATRWRAAAALALGTGAVGAQALGLAAAGLPAGVAAQAGGVAPAALWLLATVGTGSVLAVVTLALWLDERSRVWVRQARADLQRAASTDPLTELANRTLLEDRLGAAVSAADARPGGRVALMFVDLDGFKPINESFGHATGDRLLRELANRLREAVPAHHTVARLTGDKFLVLVDGDASTDALAALAGRVLGRLQQPASLDGRELAVGCSIGLAVYPQHGAASTLIAHAEAAMAAAKRSGGGTYCFFEPHMTVGVREQVELLRDLRQAIERGQLELYFQPKVHAPSGEITGAEALMRWNHPKRGLVSPAVFIPIAERFGLIRALGDWLIDEACRQARAWRDQGLRMRVAINLSVHQMRQDDLAERIADALARHRINPRLLTCEITETAAMDDTSATRELFAKLARIGVHISIDDFGTGYSSLAYLRKLPAEELKIDQGFVQDLETSEDARAIVDAVVKMAHALGLKVVAEGVETEAQHRILRSLGCHELQGYVFAKPMSAKALALWAIGDVGPRPMTFRPSLFGDTDVAPIPEPLTPDPRAGRRSATH